MKKSLMFLLSAILVIAMATSTFAISAVAVQSLAFKDQKVTVIAGSSYTVDPIVTPNNASKNFVYTSSNNKVATVNASGKVTALNAGSAVITIRTQDKKVSAKLTVTVTSKTRKDIKVTLLYNSAGRDGWNQYENSAVQQEIKRVTGVTLKLIGADNDKFNVMLASGDLPELIHAANSDRMSQLIKGGNVIALDDLIKSNGQDIQKSMAASLDFSRKNWSNGTNKLYYMPVQVGGDMMGLEASIGPSIRWDYYKELGNPSIKSEDDLLTALATMVKNHPKTADGKNVYGVGFWSDWGTWPYLLSTSPMYGYSGMGAIGAIKVDTNKYVNMVNDLNAPFWKSVKFFYKANKMGIFDLDSFIMKFDDWGAKCTAGQELLSPANWATGDFNKNNVKNANGFVTIPMDWGFQWNGIVSVPGWAGKALAITKNAKAPDRVMDLLNYMWSYEGARTMFSGVEGIHWDMVNGKPKIKAATMALKAAGGDAWAKTGIQTDLNIVGLSSFIINPNDGAPLNLFETTDVYQSILNPLQKDFSNHYGVKYPGEIFAQKLKDGKNKNQSGFNSIASALMPPAPDDIKRIEAKLNDIAPKDFAKCIMSKTDAEFDANVAEAIKDFVAAGSDKYATWYQNAWDTSVAASK